MFGFQPFLAPELGYGKAVHHAMRAIAEHTRMYGHPPDAADLDRLFDAGFFLPAASKPTHGQLKKAARRLVNRYLATYKDDLFGPARSSRPHGRRRPRYIPNVLAHWTWCAIRILVDRGMLIVNPDHMGHRTPQ